MEVNFYLAFLRINITGKIDINNYKQYNEKTIRGNNAHALWEF